LEKLELRVTGDTAEEMAASLVNEVEETASRSAGSCLRSGLSE
jgi:hypothetical protein